MNSKLHVETKRKEIDGSVGDEEPLSPAAEYFNSNAFSMCILGVMEFEIPMDLSRLVPLIQDVFIPINPRFSSIMVNSSALYSPVPTSKAAGTGIFKLHHSLGDGYSLMGALLSCLQRADDVSLPLTFPSTQREPEANDRSKKSVNVFSRVSRILCSIYDGICEFGWSVAKTGWIADDRTSIRSGSTGVGFHPAVRIFTIDLSLDKLKQIKTKLDVTINAVLTGIIFFGARLYMKENGEDARNAVSTVVVVLNTRNINGYRSIEEMLHPDNKLWGNQFTFLHISLPELPSQNYTNPVDFVTEAHKIILRKKNSPMSPLSEYFHSKTFSMCILGILEFEIPMDLSRLVPLIEAVFIPINPRFSSIMVYQPVLKIPTLTEGLPVTEYDTHLEEYLTKIGVEPLPEDKPLWEIHAINYPTTETNHYGNSYLQTSPLAWRWLLVDGSSSFLLAKSRRYFTSTDVSFHTTRARS